MKKSLTLFFLLAIAIKSGLCQFSPGYFALKDVTLIDGFSNHTWEHYTILIHGRLIEAVGPMKEVAIPDAVLVLDGRGKYVMPGLIDTHVHLATDPSHDDNRARAERDCKAMLLSGITSVRDMAGDARALASLARDANLDEIMSPDIYYAALMAGPSFFSDPRTHQSTAGAIAGAMPYMQAVTDSTDLRIAVAEAKGSGATAIKLYAAISGELAKKITTEAHRQHMLVWSHANLDKASALEVINAGVNSISHAAMVSGWNSKNIPAALLTPGHSSHFWDSVFNTLPVNDLIKAMKQNNTILDATILTFRDAGSDSSLPAKRRLAWLAMYEIGKRFTRMAMKNGIPVCTGTDLDDRKFVQREIKLLAQECDCTPMELLICATRNAAAAVGIEKNTGTIQPGKTADIIVLSANPAADINNLDKVEQVIKNGRLYNAVSYQNP